MNPDKLLEEKRKELKKIDRIMNETLIISQIKYQDYEDAQEKLKDEIKQLEANKNEPMMVKTWIDVGGGWKQRTYKNE